MSKKPTPEPDKEATPSTALQVVFGESVRAARLKAGMSQVELSRRSGIGQKEISEIELGRINLTLRTMSRLADVLDGDVAKMLNASKDDLKKP